jgi:hypothetical protein
MTKLRNIAVIFNSQSQMKIKTFRLHDHIILLRDQDLAHKTSFTLPLFIEMPVPNQKS